MEVVLGSRRSGGMFNDKVAQGRVESIWLRCATEDTKSYDNGREGAVVLLLLSTSADVKW